MLDRIGTDELHIQGYGYTYLGEVYNGGKGQTGIVVNSTVFTRSP
jgi:hypothetical protein